VALQARRRFWLGLSTAQLGQTRQAQEHWRQLLRQHPGGYYGWRAATRLGLAPNGMPAPAAAEPRWTPLNSGDARVDQLWRLGQRLEACEAWRSARRGQPPTTSAALQAEGRLREAIGDGWAGLGQQELAALRLPPGQCRLQQLIETNLYRPRQLGPLAAAARQEQVPLSLLLGVAKQESRFQSGVRSVVGAAGLLQLMPETAAELAGRPLSDAELDEPARNALLGGRYLGQLLQRWDGDPLLAVASYNAGPNAVARWLPNGRATIPELWVEAIPYPETRHYVKTVLGNTWSFAKPRRPECT
jgi:soluble lytic murein transglycosylase